jgi:hypothetical protein
VTGLAPISETFDVQTTTAAYHEAGHIVIQAALGLPLRPEGIMVGQDAKGFACYWKEPDGTDISVEANVVASFAGFYAEKRLRFMRGFHPREYFAVIWSTDWKEARALEGRFSFDYLGDRTIQAVHDELETKAQEMVAQHWPAIERIAEILLARDWEPMKPFESSTQWSESESAKYIIGDEMVRILAGLGITTHLCDSRADLGTSTTKCT